jgi:hypothetical protein
MPVEPLGDFRVNERSKSRRLDSLMGTTPKVERGEFINPVLAPSQRPKTEVELWETRRERAKIISKEDASVALKRDGSAWTDKDGYSKAPEAPAFRDGYNNTLRVLPPQEEHLHNGLQSMKLRSNPASEKGPSLAPSHIKSTHKPERKEAFTKQKRVASEVVKNPGRSSDFIHRASLRPEIHDLLANYFVKGVSLGVTATKSRDVQTLVSLFRHEHSTSQLEGGAAIGEANEHAREEVPEAEDARRKESELTRGLGNAFVSLGMTLPAGSREDPLRNDSVALEMGNRVMMAVEGSKSTPVIVEAGLRKEVAIALGRALLHIQNAAGISASRGNVTVDKTQKDRTLKVSVGHLTLQLLEATASRSGKILTRDPVRREILASALGKAVMQMDALSIESASNKHETDRNSKEAVAINKPLIPETLSSLALQSKNISKGRENKIRDILVRRPILPGADAPPATVPRHLGFR